MATTNSYWCYTCNRFVRIRTEALTCPHCTGGFVEQMAEPVQRPTEFLRRRRLPRSEARRFRRPTFSHAGQPTSPFNPVIVLRRNRPDTTGTNNNNFELYYADGAGRGLHPLPDSMSDFLMGTGFERLLDQLSQIEATGFGRALTDLPAAKSAVDSMPVVEIEPTHIGSDSHCAVCKDPFELGSEAREMPCKHIYHEDCILPWLSSNNSCPVCRHQMPTDGARRGDQGNGDEMVGLTIWRLPGGGFAVGRFAGVERGVGGDRELPVVYTEVDGGIAGFNNNNNDGAAREVAWTTRMAGSRQRNGFSSFIQRVFGCFGPSSSNSDANSNAAVSSSSSAGNYVSNNSNVYRRNGRNMGDPGSMSS